MLKQDVHFASLDNDSDSICLMDNEIQGTKVFSHHLKYMERIVFQPIENSVRILFFNYGEVSVITENLKYEFNDLTVFIGKLNRDITIIANSETNIMELIRYIDDNEAKTIDESLFPYQMAYKDAVRYSEDCKSKKTVSRMLVPARLVPKFAMGSVETQDEDAVEKHTHPMVDQYFYGLNDNNCTLIIDDISLKFRNNTLVHIPLGSSHGIISHMNDKVHYIWMDFLLNDESLKYMDEAHTIIDEK